MGVYNDSLRIEALEECLLDVWSLLEVCTENEIQAGRCRFIGVQFLKADVKEVLGELIKDRETQRDINDLEDQIYQLQKKRKVPEETELEEQIYMLNLKLSWSERDV